MNSFNKLCAFNRSRKIIYLSEEYVQDSILLNCNANKMSLSDRNFEYFYCIQTAVQSHVLSDDDLYRMQVSLNCNTKSIFSRKESAHHF